MSCSIKLEGKICWTNSFSTAFSLFAANRGEFLLIEPTWTSIEADMFAGFFSFIDHLRCATSCWKINSGESNFPDPVGNVFDVRASRFSSGSEFPSTNNWATSCENLSYAICEQRRCRSAWHPRSLISTFVVRCLDSVMPLVSTSEISRL